MAPLKPVAWMTAGSIVAATAAVWVGEALGASGLAAPVFGGMIGPLVAVAGTSIAVARAHARNPAGVMRVMVLAFAVKVLFFVAYVVAMIRILDVNAMAFGLSVTAFVVGLYGVQAAIFARWFRVSQEAR